MVILVSHELKLNLHLVVLYWRKDWRNLIIECQVQSNNLWHFKAEKALKANDCSIKQINRTTWLRTKHIYLNDQTLDLRKSLSIKIQKISHFKKDLQGQKFIHQAKNQSQTCFRNTNRLEATVIFETA